MAEVPNKTLNDIPKKDREKLRGLLNEKDVLGYAFSYLYLRTAFMNLDQTEEQADALIHDAVVAYNEKEEDAVGKKLRDKIKEIFVDYDIATLDNPDPFGRMRYYSMFEHPGSPKLSKDKLVELAPKFKISTTKIMELIEAATGEAKPYVVLMAADHKETKK